MRPPGAEVSLGLADISDAVEIAVLSRDLIEAGLHWTWTPPRVAASIRRRDTNVLVARVGERGAGEDPGAAGSGGRGLAGFGIMRYGPTDAHLELFAVHPDHRREGVGGRMLAWLEVRAANRGAQAFYERMGYQKLAALPGYYEGREPAIRMAHDLVGTGSRGTLD